MWQKCKLEVRAKIMNLMYNITWISDDTAFNGGAVNHAVYPPSAPPLPPPTAWSPPGFPAPSNTTTTTHAG